MKTDLLAVLRNNPVVVPLAFAAAMAMVAVGESSYRQAAGTLDELGAMALARTRIEGLERSLLDAEAGQRGYLLTGRREQLQHYTKAAQDVNAAFGFLDHYYDTREPAAAERLQRLRGLTQAKIAGLAEPIRRSDEGSHDAAAEALLGDLGGEQMEAIRVLSAELLAGEDLKVSASRSELYRTLLLGRVGVGALSAISLLALLMVLRQTFALERQQLDQQHHMQAAHDRLEAEVRQRTAQLTELTHHLQTAREDERNRLARDLHDELGALLTSAKLDAARIKSRLAGTAPEARERLEHLVATLDSVITLKRRIAEDLRPSALSNLGLVAALEILARESGERSGFAVHCALASVRLAPAAELVVYRVVQESVNNLSKHAAAHDVWLGLAGRDGQVEVTVRDDGAGFDPGAPGGSHYGLVGMRYRVEAEGGVLAVISAPGQGTLIRVTLPEAAAAT